MVSNGQDWSILVNHQIVKITISHWNQKVGWIARGFPQQGFGPPASYYNIFFQLKSMFPIFHHLFDFIWIYLTLFDLFCFGTSLGLSCTTYLIHHMTSSCVLNPFALEAEHLTTQGNMITADSWAAILQLPFASATEPNAILDSFMWTAIFNRTNLCQISDYTERCHFWIWHPKLCFGLARKRR